MKGDTVVANNYNILNDTSKIPDDVTLYTVAEVAKILKTNNNYVYH